MRVFGLVPGTERGTSVVYGLCAGLEQENVCLSVRPSKESFGSGPEAGFEG